MTTKDIGGRWYVASSPRAHEELEGEMKVVFIGVFQPPRDSWAYWGVPNSGSCSVCTSTTGPTPWLPLLVPPPPLLSDTVSATDTLLLLTSRSTTRPDAASPMAKHVKFLGQESTGTAGGRGRAVGVTVSASASGR
jgi:hypothetical protein|eukprot:COSAG01_NODE_5690_length_4098_cov_2.867717_5_plen_136_part_00